MIAAGLVTRSADRVLMPGQIVARLRRVEAQTIGNAGLGSFIEFDAVDLDLLGGFDPALPERYRPTVPGWYRAVCRVTWSSNGTSRRGAFINLNGTNSGPDTIGGASIQTAPSGGPTTQVGGSGSAPMDGVTDYLVLRALQNSGGDLATRPETTDAGTVMEITYVGPLEV